MLSGLPIKFGGNCDASKPIVFYEYLGFLTDTIMKASPKPGVDVTRNVYGCCCDKIIPRNVLIPTLHHVTVASDSYHDVRV